MAVIVVPGHLVATFLVPAMIAVQADVRRRAPARRGSAPGGVRAAADAARATGAPAPVACLHDLLDTIVRRLRKWSPINRIFQS
jgi:hypothetical protein